MKTRFERAYYSTVGKLFGANDYSYALLYSAEQGKYGVVNLDHRVESRKVRDLPVRKKDILGVTTGRKSFVLMYAGSQPVYVVGLTVKQYQQDWKAFLDSRTGFIMRPIPQGIPTLMKLIQKYVYTDGSGTPRQYIEYRDPLTADTVRYVANTKCPFYLVIDYQNQLAWGTTSLYRIEELIKQCEPREAGYQISARLYDPTIDRIGYVEKGGRNIAIESIPPRSAGNCKKACDKTGGRPDETYRVLAEHTDCAKYARWEPEI